ncbi:unnamed protein product [Lepeophtheirus salmonis]|uniref:(salmon louse) hypothetical protein n=1 Tax=Lepeophtheirus salmonis TaxID=72036 RepID=A0A7R8CRL6_LEPSM|nr:unnamed protein product [Lepeophtheirus salmonis]CAF2857895.1 unnamed protein product [Lepeophtheirus salmonis]
MKSYLIISLFSCVAIVLGDNSPYYVQEPNYSFKWEVKDDYAGQDFGQEEARKGSGYVADVRYEGDQKPDAYSSPQSSYSRPSYAPIPTSPVAAPPKPSLYARPSYALPPRPAYSAIQPLHSYQVTTPPRKASFIPPPTTTTARTTTETAPVFVPGSVIKEKMRLTPKLNVHPNELVNELFYGDLSKEKFKSDKKVHE